EDIANDPLKLHEWKQDQLKTWEDYLEAVEADLVGKCRSIVAACRSSGQRRQALLKKIDEGNKSGYWKGKLVNGTDKIPLVQLLRDCETRWSSTFNMIDRVLELYVAIHDFLLELEQSDLRHLLLSELEKNVLYDIHQVLQVAHLAQELLSAERTPTLSMALPVFETLIANWKELASTIPELQHFIDIGISKLEEYLGHTRKTRMYALSMIVNPGQKFSWLRSHDEKAATQGGEGNHETNAREWMLESMLSYKQHERNTTRITPAQSTSTPARSLSATEIASTSVSTGYNRLQTLNVAVRRSSSLHLPLAASSPSSTRHTSSSPPAPQTPLRQETAVELAARKSQELAEDKGVVERELARYEAAGVVPSFQNSGMVNIVEFWSVSALLHFSF
ncbi:ribonuclease H-like domain-containing protein, partial [Flammula alnicola]